MQDLPCNTFTWCGEPAGCFEPDIHEHTFGDCWLKFTEAPAVPEVPPNPFPLLQYPTAFVPFFGLRQGLRCWEAPATAFAVCIGARACRLASPVQAGASEAEPEQHTGL